MTRASVLLVLLAAICTAAGSCGSEPEEERRGGPAHSPSEDDAGPPHPGLYGAVVTPTGAPVVGAEVRVGGRLVSRTNAAGEFACWLTGANECELEVHAPHFAKFRRTVALTSRGTELLVQLAYPATSEGGEYGVSFLTDPLNRGIGGLPVELVDPTSGTICLTTESCGDGALRWPRELEHKQVIVLAANPKLRWEPPALTRLVDTAVVPARRPRGKVKRSLLVDAGPLEADRGVLRVHDSWGRRRADWPLGPGPATCMVREGDEGWAIGASSDAVAMAEYRVGGEDAMLRLVPGSTWRARAPKRVGAVELLISPWRAHVIYGPSMRDAVPRERDAKARVPFGDLDGLSPWLDLPTHLVSFQSSDPDRDVRLVSTVAGAALSAIDAGTTADLVVFEGTGSVILNMRYGAPMTGDVRVVLVRRGARFLKREDVAGRETLRWSGLCAGSYQLWFEREQEQEGLEGFEGIRSFVVRPGESTAVDVDWEHGRRLDAEFVSPR